MIGLLSIKLTTLWINIVLHHVGHLPGCVSIGAKVLFRRWVVVALMEPLGWC